MNDFTPEQLAAQARRNAIKEKASDLYAEYTPAWMAECALLGLEEVVEIGLDPCYARMSPGTTGTVDGFMSDFAADFSWDGDAVGELRSILDDPRFVPVNEHFLKELDFNLLSALERMHRDAKEFHDG